MTRYEVVAEPVTGSSSAYFITITSSAGADDALCYANRYHGARADDCIRLDDKTVQFVVL